MSPRHGARLPPPRRNREHHPSFSAALLDAIYQSLDADADAHTPPTDPRRLKVSAAERPPLSARHPPTPAALPPPVSSPRLQRPPRPCRVRPDPQPPSVLLPPPPGDGAEKKKPPTTKRDRRRKAKSSRPFACLMDALLCNRRSAKPVEAATPRAPPVVEPASAARSILSSRASRRESEAAAGGPLTPSRRAVRFSPEVAVVAGEEVGTARLRGAKAEAAAAKESAAETERRVEELLRVLGAAEESERAKASSESSSELFELETLATCGFDELPRTGVYSSRAAGPAMPRPRVP